MVRTSVLPVEFKEVNVPTSLCPRPMDIVSESNRINGTLNSRFSFVPTYKGPQTNFQIPSQINNVG